MECLCTSKIHTLNAQKDGVGRWTSGRWWGPKGGALLSGISALIRRDPIELPTPRHHVWGHQSAPRPPTSQPPEPLTVSRPIWSFCYGSQTAKTPLPVSGSSLCLDLPLAFSRSTSAGPQRKHNWKAIHTWHSAILVITVDTVAVSDTLTCGDFHGPRTSLLSKRIF